jgi:ATP-binding cassette subfamily B multidrug efflux pump
MRALGYLNKYFYKYRVRFLLGILFVVISNIFGVFPAQAIRLAFNLVQENYGLYNNFNGFALQQEIYGLFSSLLLAFGMLVLALALLKGLFMFFMRQSIIVMSRLIEYDLKNEIYAHYQNLSLSFYRRNNTGDLMARISEDVSRVRMYLGPAVMYTVNLMGTLVLVITTMLAVNVKLTMYVLIPLPILSVCIYFINSVIERKSESIQGQLSVMTTFVQEAFSGIRVLKAFAVEKYSGEVFEKETGIYKDKSLSLAKVDSVFFPLIMLLIGLSTLFTIYAGGQEVIKGNITAGNIAEFVIYINMLTWPFATLGWVTSIVQRAAASQARINEFLHEDPEIVPPAMAGGTKYNMAIAFKNVSFTYDGATSPALKDVSFTVNPGEKIAIIGSTGSGKSTLANLLLRMFDVTEGAITVDGTDIREIDLKAFRQQTGYVPQEVFLFSDSIENNIAFGLMNDFSKRPMEVEEKEALKARVLKAAENAVILENIQGFPRAFETMLGERGITLSGGQKQRVSIARAIIKEPRLLVFDDCLSAVDTRTEAEILDNLENIFKGKTVLIISHRVSSVTGADKILVLENGMIVETGNHEELMKLEGRYCETYRKQLLEEELSN